jgi:hypothetical protein
MDAAAPDPLGHPLNHEALYYINGAHFLGALPPIAVQNVLTEGHTQQKAPRPGAVACIPRNDHWGSSTRLRWG